MAVPVDVVIRGQSLEDFGFTVEGAFSGTGLNTWGFLWDCAAIWSPADPTITTVWSNCTSPPDVFELCNE